MFWDSQQVKKFFYYIQLPNFDIAAATFKEIMTRHKSTVADFFTEYNSKLLQLFVANQKKPSDIINVLVANRNKFLRLLADLKLDKEDGGFEADKANVVSKIASLKPRDLA
ncbi:hypothetical protein N665_0748s0023 [Sinapis alba]|nr:hypothetical protein N665_0748s0023 [Sinapis alba]